MYNWMDIVFIFLVFITLILGVAKGFIKQIIGILAVIIGVILAVELYPFISPFFFNLTSHRVISNFLAFFVVFLVVLCLGGVVSGALSKMIKGPAKLIDRVLGGGLGILKGILICVVIVFGLLVFPVNRKWLRDSQLAPYCLRISRAIIYVVPRELKEKFREKYQEILGKVEKSAEKA